MMDIEKKIGMERHKKSQEGLILVIDPAIKQAEVDAYNYLLTALDVVNKRPGVARQSLRFWLPSLSNNASLQGFLNANPGTLENLSGCISLGSYAHVTEKDQYSWIVDFELLIDSIVSKGIPFLGICFAHQFLAAKNGWKVDYCPDPDLAGAKRYNLDLRTLEILSPRLRALCARVTEDDWSRNTSQAQFLREVLGAINAGILLDERATNPVTAAERALSEVLKFSPSTLRAWSRHAQWVYKQPHEARLKSARYLPSLRAKCFDFDGLIHRSLPVFTFQTHPELPHTPESDVFMKNFFTLCGL